MGHAECCCEHEGYHRRPQRASCVGVSRRSEDRRKTLTFQSSSCLFCKQNVTYYLSTQYHDDGEDSLGPTIASLSLGAPSTMKIRMKYKYYHGFTKTSHKLLDIDPVLPKCENYKKRLELKTNFYNPPGTEYKGPPETREGYEKWRVERYSKEKNPKEKHQKCVDKYKEAWWASYQSIPQKERRESPPDLIKMELNHGDMVVMHGAKLQQYFEVCVSIVIILCNADHEV